MEAKWDLLPDEIWFKIIRTVLHQCDFNSLENHICFVLKNLELFNHRFFSSKSIEDLPRIYVNNPELRRKICCEHHEHDKKSWILQWCSSRYKMYVKFLWLELRLASPTTMLTLLDFFWKKRKWFSLKTFDLNNLFFVDIDF